MNKTALWIGSFIIGAGVLATAAVLWLSGSNLFDSDRRAILHFDNGVPGLYKGAPVTYLGVMIGQVDSIGLDVNQQTLKARIPVHIRLSKGSVTFSGGKDADPALITVPDLVQRGLRAKLVSQSLVTGQKSIELNMVADAPPVSIAAGPEPEIPVMADRLSALVDQLSDLPLGDVVKELRSSMSSMREALDAARGTLAIANATVGTAGQELRVVSEQAGRTLKVASDAIVQVQAGSRGALDSVTRLADTAQGTVRAAQPELMRTLAGASQAADSARLAMAHVAEMTAPDSTLRSDLESAVADLGQTARGLRDWSELLDEQPNAIIFGRQRATKGTP
jgi:paraquat-inducible protein B